MYLGLCHRDIDSVEIQSEGATSLRIRLPSISYIVARSWPDNIIGRGNQLPWHLRTDLRRFKAITIGHAVIMGRKTFLSIGKPLPGRPNVVLSRTPEIDLKNSFWHQGQRMLLWAENRESALFFADVISIADGKEDFFVIGGSEMYRIFGDLFNKIYLTEVLTGKDLHLQPDDAVFEYKIDNRKWKTIETQDIPLGPEDDYPSRFTVLERRTKYVRYVEVEDYYTETQSRDSWIQKQLDLFDSERDWRKPFKIPYQYQLFEEPA